LMLSSYRVSYYTFFNVNPEEPFLITTYPTDAIKEGEISWQK
jgi:hypothetical protein